MNSKLIKSLVAVTLLATLGVAQSGCSFAGASPKVDLTLAAVSLGGSALMFNASDNAQDRCQEDGCWFAGMGEAMIGGGLAIAGLGYLVGAAYGYSRDSDKAEQVGVSDEAAEAERRRVADAEYRRAWAKEMARRNQRRRTTAPGR